VMDDLIHQGFLRANGFNPVHATTPPKVVYRLVDNFY
jgi:hypothetical protein